MEIFHAETNTTEFDELDLLSLFVKDYDDRYYSLPEIDALKVIKIKMLEIGIKNKDVNSIIGSKGHISNLLLVKREIMLKMAVKLKNYFGIPIEPFLRAA
jgi:HTH-type transcriptional regulator/antitoxin HigA